jgi:hypothetical protein
MMAFRKLVLVLMIISLQCMPVLAANGDYDLSKEGEAYTLAYETTAPAGTQVVLLMMSGSSLTDGKIPINLESGITYIDQTAVAAGAETNTVTFSGFIPMDTEEEYHSLYLGGLSDGPVWVATISVSGILVSGEVEYFGADNLALNLYDSTKTTIEKAISVSKSIPATDRTALFAFPNVTAGTYYLKTAQRDYCVSEFKEITLRPTDLVIPSILYKVYAGDVNNNSAINVYDITALLNDFGKTEGFVYGGSDVNRNGAVNVYDISALLDGFGKSN